MGMDTRQRKICDLWKENEIHSKFGIRHLAKTAIDQIKKIYISPKGQEQTDKYIPPHRKAHHNSCMRQRKRYTPPKGQIHTKRYIPPHRRSHYNNYLKNGGRKKKKYPTQRKCKEQMQACRSVNIRSSLPDLQTQHQLPPYQWLPPQYNITDSPEKAAHTGTEPSPTVNFLNPHKTKP